jgi:hypothetical protein
VDSAELTEWMAYADLDPFGPPAEEMRFARLMALVVNQTSWGKEEAAVPADFLPGGRPPARQMTVEESREALKRQAGVQ